MIHHTLTYALVLAALTPLATLAQTLEMPVGDITLPYISEGEGAPVLFVHGAISDRRAWDSYQSLISEDRQFVAYTQRYFGTGDWPDSSGKFQRSTHVQDLIAFVEGLNAGAVHLVTWSYSGEIGVHAMLERPDLFLSAVHYEPVLDRLVDGSPGGDNATRELFSKFGPAIAEVEKNQPKQAALRFIEAVFELQTGGAVGESGEVMWRQNGHTVAPYLAMDPSADLDCQTLSNLHTPTLVVQGAQSFTRFSIMAERLAFCVGNGLVITMPDVNHNGPYRRPDEFASMIKSFLSLLD